ncbi:hypothetical protein QKT49_gp297 [Acanthamoeba castellanii medusavirus]|uniref:Uncharacterized protein n=1 Tax=Acanthamoeba castellanii medusavirus J1 TaxID=3114988 RepID=A0A3T1CXB2_9VIRU|nr:hypothetical protein QKT49_gp297 [Acanthamoeba castellanii medusavirus]BBI30466.1 hypothetical protein [Acanthamoeba castellanii medusavirus J1]
MSAKSASKSESATSSQESGTRATAARSKPYVASKRAQPDDSKGGKRARSESDDENVKKATPEPSKRPRTAEETTPKRGRAAEETTPKRGRTASEEDANNGTEKINIKESAERLRAICTRLASGSLPSPQDLAANIKERWLTSHKATEQDAADTLPARAIRSMHEHLPAIADKALAEQFQPPTADEIKEHNKARATFQGILDHNKATIERLKRRLAESEKNQALGEEVLQEFAVAIAARDSMPDSTDLRDAAIAMVREYQARLAEEVGVSLQAAAPAPVPAPAPAMAPGISTCDSCHVVRVPFACPRCQGIVCSGCTKVKINPSPDGSILTLVWDCARCGVEAGRQVLPTATPMEVARAPAPSATTTTSSTATSAWAGMVAPSPLSFLPGAADELAALMLNDQGNVIPLGDDKDDEYSVHSDFAKQHSNLDF